ncbi:MAG: Hsp70 family protein [Thermodesulfobacteriota bacterium]
MPDLTIDLGNYNTIVTFREHDGETRDLLKGVARRIHEFPGTLFVPSLVHLGERTLLGEEVLSEGLYEDEGCFRDLKDHILHPAPVARNVRGLRQTHKKAAAIFLSELTRRLAAEVAAPLNVVFLFPNLGGELFRECLRYVDLESARSVTLVDEDTAVALGYGLNLFVDDRVLVFDFGFSSLRARVLQFHWLGREAYTPPVIQASASLPVGTADLRMRILRELHVDEAGADLPAFYWKKFRLHDEDSETLSHEKFEELLRKEGLGARVREVLDRALEEVSLAGVRPEDIRKVLLVGGGTRIPEVRRIVSEVFGDRVVGELPEVAAGRGGVEFLSDRPVDDMVRETYSIQVRDPITGEYRYPPVVEKFSRYPTRTPTARYVVNTFYDGQYELHLQVFRSTRQGDGERGREIVYGEDGKIAFVQGQTQEVHEPAMAAPLVIPVQPPGRIGERRFLLEFGVDNQKRLVVTVKDLREERMLWEDRPLLEMV